MSEKFKAEIELGNAAMQDGNDVSHALKERVLGKLEEGYTSGTIMDYNGNSVGSWSLGEEPEATVERRAIPDEIAEGWLHSLEEIESLQDDEDPDSQLTTFEQNMLHTLRKYLR